MEKIKGVQELVLGVVQICAESNQSIISKQQIKSELMKTDLKALDVQKYTGDKTSKLDRLLDQALFQLKKKGKLKSSSHGTWSLPKGNIKYKPKPCRALIPEYLATCPKCHRTTKQISETPINNLVCPTCNKKMAVEVFQYYCPIRKSYIGSPTAQCELLHGTDYHLKQKKVDPMKICYFANRPTPLGLQYASRKIEIYEERQQRLSPRAHVTVNESHHQLSATRRASLTRRVQEPRIR